MKKLFIIRHAKSSWDHPHLRDIDRPLNTRGFKDAPRMAQLFKKEVGSIDTLISSPALRAFTTSKEFAKELGIPDNSIIVEEKIYGASINGILDLINGLNDGWSSVCIFGHNPTFTYLAEELADVNIGNLPTCGIVGIEFNVSEWAAVSFGSGEQFLYEYPKKLD